jgi:hypothetical protein
MKQVLLELQDSQIITSVRTIVNHQIKETLPKMTILHRPQGSDNNQINIKLSVNNCPMTSRIFQGLIIRSAQFLDLNISVSAVFQLFQDLYGKMGPTLEKNFMPVVKFNQMKLDVTIFR